MYDSAGIVCRDLDLLQASAELAGMLGQDVPIEVCDDAVFCGASVSRSVDGNLTVIFSGRLENSTVLADALPAGAVPAGADGAELISGLWQEYGNALTAKLEGSFFFAVYDRDAGRILLAHDQLGAMPLYYFVNHGKLVFANRAAVLFRHPGVPDDPDSNAVSNFLSLQYIPEPDTIFRRVRQLPHGHMLEFKLDEQLVSIRCFRKFSFFLKSENPVFAESADELRSVLECSFKRHFDSGSGILLSGGIDSSILAAMAARTNRNGEPVDVFTVGFSDPGYDERHLAALTVARINEREGREVLRHHVREIAPVDFSLVEEIAGSWDEPYANSSILPTVLVCRFAAEHGISNLLGGDGADELFGGYERYEAMGYAARLDFLPVKLRAGLFEFLRRRLPDSGERTTFGRLRRFCRFIATDDPVEGYFSILDRCPQSVKEQLFGEKLQSALRYNSLDVFRRLWSELSSTDAIEKFAELDMQSYLPGDGMMKLCIASALAGVEIRTPFLDREVLRTAIRMPWEFKLSGNERKCILKRACKDLLFEEIVRQPKRGFGIPLAAWIRGHWQKRIHELLFDGKLCSGGFCNRQVLRNIWEAHISGRRDHSYLIWSLTQLALFLDRH